MKVNTILKKYRLPFGFTFLLILLEAALAILYPLLIGFAIDDALEGSSSGAIQLGALGLVSLLVGVGRRVFDSRFYARVYQFMGAQLLAGMKGQSPSKKSARLAMLGEVVEFLENSLPELIHSVIGLLGVVAIIFALNLNVFLGSLLVTLLIFVVYGLTSNRTTKLNKASNDEFEKQVQVISTHDEAALKFHLKKMMKWNIRLSDLEAINFSISWVVLMAFLVGAIVVAVNDGMVKYGALFALVMYVFQYMENVVNLPLFYQNWLRLREIKGRLEEA